MVRTDLVSQYPFRGLEDRGQSIFEVLESPPDWRRGALAIYVAYGLKAICVCGPRLVGGAANTDQ